ncbi:hypothetical protein ACFL6B_01530 [Thermodesulfobacteriota bacterium]
MNDIDADGIKTEIDAIMKGVDNIMKRIESLNLIKEEESMEIKNEE